MLKKHHSDLIKTGLFFLIYSFAGCATTKSSMADDLLLSGSVISCGHMNVYQLSEDNKSYIQIIINTTKIALNQENTWDLTSVNEHITVTFKQYQDDVSNRLCNDIAGKRIKPFQTVEVKSGILVLTMTDLDWQQYKKGTRFKVDLNAKGLVLDEDKTYALKINQTPVGWLPG